MFDSQLMKCYHEECSVTLLVRTNIPTQIATYLPCKQTMRNRNYPDKSDLGDTLVPLVVPWKPFVSLNW